MYTKGASIILASAVTVVIVLYRLSTSDHSPLNQRYQVAASTGSPNRTNQARARQLAPVPTLMAASEIPADRPAAAIVENGVTNWVVIRQPSRMVELAKLVERRRAYAEEGRMQEVARREEKIAERIRLLRKGMTVAEALDLMGLPDQVGVLVENGEGQIIRIMKGTVDDALQHPESVGRLVYTPFENEKRSPYVPPTIRPPSSPYQVFELYFGLFSDQERGSLYTWTEPYEDELARLDSGKQQY